MAEPTGSSTSAVEHTTRRSVSSVPLAAVSLSQTCAKGSEAVLGGARSARGDSPTPEADQDLQSENFSFRPGGSTPDRLRRTYESSLRIVGSDSSSPAELCPPVSPVAIWPRSSPTAPTPTQGCVDFHTVASSPTGVRRNTCFGRLPAWFPSLPGVFGASRPWTGGGCAAASATQCPTADQDT